MLASGSWDQNIYLWDLVAGRLTGKLKGHIGSVTTVAFSSSANIIASGSWDRTVRLWDVKSGTTLSNPFEGHSKWIHSVGFFPGGTRVASSSGDGTIRIWDVERGRTVMSLVKGHTEEISSISISPDGSQIISGSYDRTLRLWDARNGAFIGKPYEGHTGIVRAVAFAPNGIHVASGSSDKTVRVWDIRSGDLAIEPFTGHTSEVKTVAFSPSGTRIASGAEDNKVIVWSVPTSSCHRDSQSVDGLEPLMHRNGSMDSGLGTETEISEYDEAVDTSDDDAKPHPIGTLRRRISLQGVGVGPRGIGMEGFGTSPERYTGTVLVKGHFRPATHMGSTHTSAITSWQTGSPPEPARPSSACGLSFQRRVEVRSKQMSVIDMFRQVVNHGCIDLSSRIDPSACSVVPVHGGGIGDIYKGRIRDGPEVAIKVWRFSLMEDNPKNMKRAMREIYHWSKIRHKNIQRLMGVVLYHGRLGMVSRWMEKGNLKDYIRKNPSVDRYSLCHQVASGVAHLHKEGMIHGDLKAANILISKNGTPKLSDFDHSILSECTLIFSETTNFGGGTLRWMAPELLRSTDDGGTGRGRECDVYALGMTILEIFTGKLPYAEYKEERGIIVALFKQQPPVQPEELCGLPAPRDILWPLLLKCWDHDPSARPSASHIQESLGVLVDID